MNLPRESVTSRAKSGANRHGFQDTIGTIGKVGMGLESKPSQSVTAVCDGFGDGFQKSKVHEIYEDNISLCLSIEIRHSTPHAHCIWMRERGVTDFGDGFGSANEQIEAKTSPTLARVALTREGWPTVRDAQQRDTWPAVASDFRPRFLPGRQEKDTPRGTVAIYGTLSFVPDFHFRLQTTCS